MFLQQVSQRPQPAVLVDRDQEIQMPEACPGSGWIQDVLGELGCVLQALYMLIYTILYVLTL